MRYMLIPLLLTAVSATADDVHLKDGRVLKGKVVAEKGRLLIIDRDRIHAVAKNEVARVVERKSFMEIYEERLEQLPVDDAEAIYEFGRWLEKNDWSSRARRAYEEVLEIDPEHRGARRALGYKLFEGEWVSPEELNRRKGLVEFEGRWYTKHDLAEYKAAIERDAKLRQAIEHRRKVNAKLNRMVRRFATFDKKKRHNAYQELYAYAEQLNSPEMRKLADDAKAYYDEVVKVLCARMLARTQVSATHTKLKKPIDTFTTTLGAAIAIIAAQNPVKIQLPELTIQSVSTTVDIPAGCR